jgi:hypothetical protein
MIVICFKLKKITPFFEKRGNQISTMNYELRPPLDPDLPDPDDLPPP